MYVPAVVTVIGFVAPMPVHVKAPPEPALPVNVISPFSQTVEEPLIFGLGSAFSEIIIASDPSQPFASTTVTVYVFAALKVAIRLDPPLGLQV